MNSFHLGPKDSSRRAGIGNASTVLCSNEKGYSICAKTQVSISGCAADAPHVGGRLPCA